MSSLRNRRRRGYPLVDLIILWISCHAIVWAQPPDPSDGFDFFRQSLRIRELQLEIGGHLENFRIDQAIETVEMSLSLTSSDVWPMRPLIDANLKILSDLHIWKGEYRKAAEVAGKRVAAHRRWGAPDLDLASALLELGQVERLAGNPVALEHLVKARDLRQRQLGDDHPDTAEVDGALGAWHFEQENRTQAREYLERSKTSLEGHFGLLDPRLSMAYINLAALERSEGKRAEARVLLEMAQEIEEASGESPPMGLARVKSSQGLLFLELGSWQEALVELEAARNLLAPLFGDDHPELLPIWLHSGMALSELGEIAVAEERLRRAVRIGQTRLGDQHRLTLGARHALATHWARVGSWVVGNNRKLTHPTN